MTIMMTFKKWTSIIGSFDILFYGLSNKQREDIANILKNKSVTLIILKVQIFIFFWELFIVELKNFIWNRN